MEDKMAKSIKKSVDNIREECDSIEEEIEPKKARTHGDPIVQLD
jgi:hypothetical protein